MSKLIGKLMVIEKTLFEILEDITDPKSDIIRYYARTSKMAKDEASHIIELNDGELRAIDLNN